MKKLFSLVSAIALTLPILAGSISFRPADFSGQGVSGTGGEMSATKGAVTISCDKGFGHDSSIRFYKNSNVTVSAGGATITSIHFSFESSQYNGNLPTDTLVNDTIWRNAMSLQARCLEIVVNGDFDDIAELPVDTVSVTEALARLAAGQKGECYIRGQVGTIYTNNVETYGNISYWLHDADNHNDSIQAYRMKAAGNTAYANATSVEFVSGDEILVYATGLTVYHNNNTNEDINETTGGYYVRTISGATIVNVSFAYGTATRTGVEGEYNWTIDLQAAQSATADRVSLVILNSRANAIAGYYVLQQGSTAQINGETSDITGFIKLTFKNVGSNGYNIYGAEMVVSNGTYAYRLVNDVEIDAVANDDELVLLGDRPFVPNPGDTITCAQAKEYGQTLDQGVNGVTVTVIGYVTDLFSNGITFWMDDEQGTAKTIQAYKSVLPSGVALQNGTKVAVTGPIQNYQGSTIEINQGTVTVLEGGVESQTIDATVAEAFAAGEALSNGETTTDYYRVSGYVTSVVEEYNAQYGNISFYMNDAQGGEDLLEVYRGKCDAAVGAAIAAGTKVTVLGQVQKFHQDATDEKPERTIIEMVNATVTIEGTLVDHVTIESNVVKSIQNGQLIIICNGVRFNAQGQQL